MNHRRLIALLMVCAYLVLPLDGLANLYLPFSAPKGEARALPAPADAGSPKALFAGGGAPPEYALQISPASPADSHCPCSDRHGADGCSFSCSCCSCCSFGAPLPAGIAWRSPQPLSPLSALEPLQRFPEVYLSIFVPPQNRA